MIIKDNIFKAHVDRELELPLSSSLIKAGFPSPADDFVDLKLDLNRELIKNPSATFFARVSGSSMIGDGVNDGDLLLIDRSIEPYNGSMAVCFLDGEFTLKRVDKRGDKIFLVPSNKDFNEIEVNQEDQFIIWGVVKYIIKKV